ncbi:alpha/beta fold hydrolase [Undibacterium sp. LX40W]|uniref:Alpha/beta fold hydrolase n=1 Tax=Undibacterium nitidum TaxID=2762298 RepID=A0A923KTR1_9BURK|nr:MULTISPECIES: alpha/beta fold hydrolase [Undibacterium]MBC3881879.1 alpha/beta fold hydrolase [Undibacterium nitidum]MBC3892124.1 alpha/beta fold hydrolase [Undibacterium sp. LX40W]
MAEDLSILTRTANPPDATIAYGGEPDQIADIRYGSRGSDLPLLVLIHGGFWKPEYDRAHAEAMSTALAEAGWTTLTLEYRRISGEPDVTVQDLSTAIESLPSRVDRHNGKLLLVGHSAGGHLVLWAAAKNSDAPIQGVLALAPAADLEMAHTMKLGDGAVERFLGQGPSNRQDLNPMLMPAPATVVTILHGAEDDIVPLAVAKSYCTAFAETRMVQLPDSGHFALIDPASTAWASVVSELESLSKR